MQTYFDVSESLSALKLPSIYSVVLSPSPSIIGDGFGEILKKKLEAKDFWSLNLILLHLPHLFLFLSSWLEDLDFRYKIQEMGQNVSQIQEEYSHISPRLRFQV